jgi:inner membrane protein
MLLLSNTKFFVEYHHFLHNVSFAICIAIFVGIFAHENRLKSLLFAFGLFHLHLFCDLIGSKSPDGYQWPIPYFSPFSNELYSWQYQWELNAWQNIVIAILLILIVIRIARKSKESPFEFFSKRLDTAFVKLLQQKD